MMLMIMMTNRIIRMPAEGALDYVFYAGDDYDSDYNDLFVNWMMMTKINRMITMMSKPCHHERRAAQQAAATRRGKRKTWLLSGTSSLLQRQR